MKIELNKTQLLEILTSHFGVPVEDVTISALSKADLIQREMSRFRYNADEKVPAIKCLRQLAFDQNWGNGNFIGLCDAKWAVENFARFIEFVRVNDRLPAAGYNELK